MVVVAAIIISTALTLQSTHRSVIGAMEAADTLPPGPSAIAAKGKARVLLLFIVGLQVLFGVVLKLCVAQLRRGGGGGGSAATAPLSPSPYSPLRSTRFFHALHAPPRRFFFTFSG
jgi:hypothetical protein